MTEHHTHRRASETDVSRPTSRLRWLLPALLLVGWLVIASVGGPFQGRLAEVQENDSAAFLPDGVESTEVTALAEGFTDDDTFPAFVVVETTDGSPLTPEQLGASRPSRRRCRRCRWSWARRTTTSRTSRSVTSWPCPRSPRPRRPPAAVRSP